jgi:hypothetical protein
LYLFAQPDLPCRLRHGIPLEAGDGAKYYTYGTSDPASYINYSFYFTSLNREMTASA